MKPEKNQRRPARITVAALYGGSGASWLAANLASTLGHEFNFAVLLCDLTRSSFGIFHDVTATMRSANLDAGFFVTNHVHAIFCEIGPLAVHPSKWDFAIFDAGSHSSNAETREAYASCSHFVLPVVGDTVRRRDCERTLETLSSIRADRGMVMPPVYAIPNRLHPLMQPSLRDDFFRWLHDLGRRWPVHIPQFQYHHFVKSDDSSPHHNVVSDKSTIVTPRTRSKVNLTMNWLVDQIDRTYGKHGIAPGGRLSSLTPQLDLEI